MISRFKDKVLLPEPEFEAILRQAWRTRLLADELRRRLNDEHTLLLNALQQLALARGAKDAQHFARSWLAERRSA